MHIRIIFLGIAEVLSAPEVIIREIVIGGLWQSSRAYEAEEILPDCFCGWLGGPQQCVQRGNGKFMTSLAVVGRFGVGCSVAEESFSLLAYA